MAMLYLDMFLIDVQLVREVSSCSHQPLVLLLELSQQPLHHVKRVQVHILASIRFCHSLGVLVRQIHQVV